MTKKNILKDSLEGQLKKKKKVEKKWHSLRSHQLFYHTIILFTSIDKILKTSLRTKSLKPFQLCCC